MLLLPSSKKLRKEVNDESPDRMQPSSLRYRLKNETGGQPQIRQGGGDHGRSVSPTYVEEELNTAPPKLQANGNFSYTSGTLQIILSPEGRVVTIETL